MLTNTKQMQNASKVELFAAMQACMIYLIMYIIDHAPEEEVNGLEILLALHASPTFCSQFR